MKYLLIAAGGSVGAVSRYLVMVWMARLVPGAFPWGTLAVNLSGSFLIGFLWAVFEGMSDTHHLRVFFFLGLLGSFTTFSAFTLESFHLIRGGRYGALIGYAALSVILGLLLVCAGYAAARQLG